MEAPVKVIDKQDVLRRAHADWARKSGAAFRPCEARHVEVHGWERLEYVVLFDETRLLVVYRVRFKGQLKRLKQWPAELEEVRYLARGAATRGREGSAGPVTPAAEAGEAATPARSVRNDPEILGLRLAFTRFRAIAARAGNEEWVRRFDAGIEVLKNA
jgi:hypothetical protein